MLKKIISLVLILLLIISLFTIAYAKEKPIIEVDKLQLKNGVIGIKVDNIENEKIKVLIQLDDKKIYYDIENGEEYQYFPLQLGNGKYKIGVLENVEDKKYKYVYKKNIEVKIENEKDVFLNSIKLINWNKEMESIKLAIELTKDCETELEKVQAIYKYMTENLTYDKEKTGLTSKYIPNIEQTLEDKKGICYDFSSLFAAMMRSQGIPTKLVKGKSKFTKAYHAWNEVYIEELDEWVVIDITKGSAYFHEDKENNMIEDSENFEKDFEY